jgi:hypothetical protein
MHLWARAVAIFAGIAASTLAGTFIFMLVVDPYNICMLVTKPGVNKFTPTVQFQSRLVKAVGIIRNRPNVILLGSSIVDNAFKIPGATLGYEDHRLSHVEYELRSPSPILNAGIRNGGLMRT